MGRRRQHRWAPRAGIALLAALAALLGGGARGRRRARVLDRRRAGPLEHRGGTARTRSTTRSNTERRAMQAVVYRWYRELGRRLDGGRPSQTDRLVGPRIGAAWATGSSCASRTATRVRRAAFDALPRRPLRRSAPTALYAPGFSVGAAGSRSGDLHLHLHRRRRLAGRVALPRPLAVDVGVDLRRHLRRALDPGAGRAPAGSRVRGLLRRAARLRDDQRARVRRQHAGLPRA